MMLTRNVLIVKPDIVLSCYVIIIPLVYLAFTKVCAIQTLDAKILLYIVVFWQMFVLSTFICFLSEYSLKLYGLISL